ncbi:recombinase family protein [Streptomyces sp. NPDC051577]|uniref:recombinase family protein n=1 Tax=Streptomyces sp. NPDC051577 TaxID=3155166 RepID=UPI00342FBC14
MPYPWRKDRREVPHPPLRPHPRAQRGTGDPRPRRPAPRAGLEAGPDACGGPGARTERPVRIGYARTSTARQELAGQLEALRRAECHKIFQEQISTRVKVRPELEKALALARQFKEAAPETPVIFTVHELKRLARNAAELMALSAELQAGGIQLELLTGPLTGIAANRLDILRRLEGGSVDPHATAAMHAVRFATTILWPTVPNTPPPGFRHDSERLLQLAANWCGAALELGEFAAPRPTLRLVRDTPTPS